MTLVADSYEKFIWGFNLKTLTLDSSTSQNLKPLFSYPSHLSTIISVAVSGTVAVSDGADDTIKIYNLSISTELENLTDPTGAVTALSFYNSSLNFPRNLLSGSDDKTVCIYDADPFVHLKTIKVHKKAVNELSIHCSGKIALTVERDSCLGMLNLVKGRRIFFCRLDMEASLVSFHQSGDMFFMIAEENVMVHKSEDATLVLEMENQKRVLCIASGSWYSHKEKEIGVQSFLKGP